MLLKSKWSVKLSMHTLWYAFLPLQPSPYFLVCYVFWEKNPNQPTPPPPTKSQKTPQTPINTPPSTPPKPNNSCKDFGFIIRDKTDLFYSCIALDVTNLSRKLHSSCGNINNFSAPWKAMYSGIWQDAECFLWGCKLTCQWNISVTTIKSQSIWIWTLAKYKYRDNLDYDFLAWSVHPMNQTKKAHLMCITVYMWRKKTSFLKARNTKLQLQVF